MTITPTAMEAVDSAAIRSRYPTARSLCEAEQQACTAGMTSSTPTRPR